MKLTAITLFLIILVMGNAIAAPIVIQVFEPEAQQAASTKMGSQSRWVDANTSGYLLHSFRSDASATVERLNWTGTNFTLPPWEPTENVGIGAFPNPTQMEFFGLQNAGNSVRWFDSESMERKEDIVFRDPFDLLDPSGNVTNRPCTDANAVTIVCNQIGIQGNTTGIIWLGRNAVSPVGIWAYEFFQWGTDNGTGKPEAEMIQVFNTTAFEPSTSCFWASPGGSFFAYMPSAGVGGVSYFNRNMDSFIISQAANTTLMHGCQWEDDNTLVIVQQAGTTVFAEYYDAPSQSLIKVIGLPARTGNSPFLSSYDSRNEQTLFNRLEVGSPTNGKLSIVNESLPGITTVSYTSTVISNHTSSQFVSPSNRYFVLGGDLYDVGEDAFPGVPPNAPENVTVSVSGGTNLLVDWDPPGFDGGSPILYYTVYRNDSLNGVVIQRAVVTAPITNYLDTTVQCNVSYQYSITASNAEGESDGSDWTTLQMASACREIGGDNGSIFGLPDPDNGQTALQNLADSMGVNTDATKLLVGILFVILLTVGLGIMFRSGIMAAIGGIVGMAFDVMLGLIPTWLVFLLGIVLIALLLFRRTTGGSGE